MGWQSRAEETEKREKNTMGGGRSGSERKDEGVSEGEDRKWKIVGG